MGKESNDKSGGVQIPGDLSTLSQEDLDSLETSAADAFDTLTNDEALDAAGLAEATTLADGIDAIRAERGTREQAAAELAAGKEALQKRIHGGDDEGDGSEGDGESAEATPAEPALVAAGARKKTNVLDVIKPASKLNVRLSDAQKFVGDKGPRTNDKEAVLIASADIRGFTQGGVLNGYADLVKAFTARARTLPDGRGALNYVPIAQLQREHTFNLSEDSSMEDAYAVLQAAANPEALIAAGGWCAPSTISYDFFNIVCEDGMLDIPTTGITRGGMRWPTSPSFGDLAASPGLWTWNETQDIAAATGTAQSGTKTCARVPCASFNESRLDCDGICITAGNFTTDAWPEQLANFLRLVNAAHAHRVNTRLIAKIAAASTPVTGLGAVSQGVAVPILDAIEMQVVDYRVKYAMCDGSILEAVFPNWMQAMVRADLAKRKGWDSPNSAFLITDAEIASWFTLRGIRAQFVQDWQVRAAGLPGQAAAMVAWPATIQFLLYAAGTWVKGNGLQLDLGIIRDSTLNTTNDYTAAWSEDCWLVAQIGHESRLVTVPICANGATGADVTYTCPAL
jgi:hypothetical protein